VTDDPTEEEQQLVEEALLCVAVDSEVAHWPTVAGYLAAEVRRLRAATADAEERGRQRGVQPFRDLFSGGPDTSCRTTWRHTPGTPFTPEGQVECVEVPLDDLRQTFADAGDES
jgi:hypothetical protein